MHPLNKLLCFIGLRATGAFKIEKIPNDFMREFNKNYKELKNNKMEFEIYKDLWCDIGSHPQHFADFECIFAAKHLAAEKPASILDIGSYRWFIIGLLAHYKVTTLDIREREPILDGETVLTGDAKQLDIPDNSFDTVVSLCALEHFGLGRYGDEFDIDGDKKGFNEMVRVLKPGGILIFSTTITRAAPSIGFNANRMYDYKMLRAFCKGLELVEESFYSQTLGQFCTLEQVTALPEAHDVYMGCWRKV